MWEIYQTAKTWKCRPSDLLHITDAYTAYCVDGAVAEFGRALEGELSGVEGKNKKEVESKSKRIMRRWLDLPQQFREPGMPTRQAQPDSQ